MSVHGTQWVQRMNAQIKKNLEDPKSEANFQAWKKSWKKAPKKKEPIATVTESSESVQPAND